MGFRTADRTGPEMENPNGILYHHDPPALVPGGILSYLTAWSFPLFFLSLIAFL